MSEKPSSTTASSVGLSKEEQEEAFEAMLLPEDFRSLLIPYTRAFHNASLMNGIMSSDDVTECTTAANINVFIGCLLEKTDSCSEYIAYSSSGNLVDGVFMFSSYQLAFHYGDVVVKHTLGANGYSLVILVEQPDRDGSDDLDIFNAHIFMQGHSSVDEDLEVIEKILEQYPVLLQVFRAHLEVALAQPIATKTSRDKVNAVYQALFVTPTYN